VKWYTRETQNLLLRVVSSSLTGGTKTLINYEICPLGEMVYTRDLKSLPSGCQFESDRGHQNSNAFGWRCPNRLVWLRSYKQVDGSAPHLKKDHMYSKILESFPYVETKDHAMMFTVLPYTESHVNRNSFCRCNAVDESKFAEMIDGINAIDFVSVDHLTLAQSQICNFTKATSKVAHQSKRGFGNTVAILDDGLLVWYQGLRNQRVDSAVCRCEDGIALNENASNYFCKLRIDPKTLTEEFYEHLETKNVKLIIANLRSYRRVMPKIIVDDTWEGFTQPGPDLSNTV
jgi:hypothetical protein